MSGIEGREVKGGVAFAVWGLVPVTLGLQTLNLNFVLLRVLAQVPSFRVLILFRW